MVVVKSTRAARAAPPISASAGERRIDAADGSSIATGGVVVVAVGRKLTVTAISVTPLM